MSRIVSTIEIDEWKAHEIIISELLHERAILKKRTSHIENKKEYLAAIEMVLDYFSNDWRTTTKK